MNFFSLVSSSCTRPESMVSEQRLDALNAKLENEISRNAATFATLKEELKKEIAGDAAMAELRNTRSLFLIEAYKQSYDNLKLLPNLLVIIPVGLAAALLGADTKNPYGNLPWVGLLLTSALSAAGAAASLSRYTKKDFTMFADGIEKNKPNLHEEINKIKNRRIEIGKSYTLYIGLSIILFAIPFFEIVLCNLGTR